MGIEDDPSKVINNFSQGMNSPHSGKSGMHSSAPSQEHVFASDFRSDSVPSTQPMTPASHYTRDDPSVSTQQHLGHFEQQPNSHYRNTGHVSHRNAHNPRVDMRYMEKNNQVYCENNVKSIPSWGRNDHVNVNAQHFEKANQSYHENIKPMHSWGSGGSQDCKLSIVSGLSQIGSDMMEPLPIDAADFEVSPNIFNHDAGVHTKNNGSMQYRSAEGNFFHV